MVGVVIWVGEGRGNYRAACVIVGISRAILILDEIE